MEFSPKFAMKRKVPSPVDLQKEIFVLRSRMDELVDELSHTLREFNEAIKDYSALYTEV